MNFSDELVAAGLRTPPFSTEGRIAYWESVARLAIFRFRRKADFMNWVFRNYAVKENRFAADVCWDIMMIQLSTNGTEPHG
jgi:hypothetical protein